MKLIPANFGRESELTKSDQISLPRFRTGSLEGDSGEVPAGVSVLTGSFCSAAGPYAVVMAGDGTHRDEEAEGVVGRATLARDVIAQLFSRAQRIEHGLIQQLHQQLRHAALEHRGAAALVVVDGAAVLVLRVEGAHATAPLPQRHLRSDAEK